MKRIYARPGFAGLRNLDQDPERRLLLSTIFLFGEYFKPMQVIPMVLAAKCGNQPKKAEAATKKAAAAKA
jgi:hypothetical protein